MGTPGALPDQRRVLAVAAPEAERLVSAISGVSAAVTWTRGRPVCPVSADGGGVSP
jgi:hypothetical protein